MYGTPKTHVSRKNLEFQSSEAGEAPGGVVRIDAVAQISKLQRAQAVGRVLWRLSNRHYAVRGGVAAARSVGKATARTTRILVLEVTGFFFAVFTMMGLAAAWRQWEKIQSGESSAPVSHVIVTLAFTATFAYFSASSFWRARGYAANKESGNA